MLDVIQNPAPRESAPAEDHARDAYIAGRLVTAYALDDQLAPFALKVDVRDGTVTVSGVVDDRVLRELALEIAQGVEGVREVHSEITVEAPAPHRSGNDAFATRYRNASLAAQVKSRLLWNGDTHSAPIEVAVEDDVVILTGEVASAHVRQVAGQLAADLQRVRRVDNRICVTPSPQR